MVAVPEQKLCLIKRIIEFAINKKITIEQKYLTKGYTQIECDSVHSTNENKLKNTDIFYRLIKKSAGQKPFPYNVKYYVII